MTSTCKYCGNLLQNGQNSITYTKKESRDVSWWCFNSLCGNNKVTGVEETLTSVGDSSGRYQRRKTIHFETDVINTVRRKSIKAHNTILKSMVCVIFHFPFIYFFLLLLISLIYLFQLLNKSCH
jgi:hypothetical protein